MRQLSLLISIVACACLTGCAAGGGSRGPSYVGPARLFDGMGSHRRAITTTSPDAQRYFDQGLIWAYAFNHDEAIRSFQHAADLDPQCAMAWWGVALCHGPHINNPIVPPTRARAAWEAVQRALQLKASASPVEQALIDALSRRYAESPTAERRPLDEAYAAGMGEAYKRFPNDSDVATLYAEALMDLQPWDVWTHAGEPKGRALEILAVLERAMSLDAGNPGANHLYIHACEAGPHPEKADAAASRLRTAVPIAGHLVHMPSHIDVQVGRWQLAADQNERAIEADRTYRALSPRQDFYRVYMAHNHHFLSFAAMMEGCHAKALRAAREMLAGIPADYARENAPLVDGMMSIVLDVHMRFGEWDAILGEKRPATHFPIATAMWHFMRGVAYSAKGRLDAAQREQSAFRDAVQRVPEGAMIAVNPAAKTLGIASHVLEAEIAYRSGRIDDAVRELREAVKIEDSLVYMEPPEWMHPTRQILGAFLLDAGRHAEAAQVYREDLANWPENGWSLYGLGRALRACGELAQAEDSERRFHSAWSRADTQIGASCLCADPARSAPRSGAR